MSLPDYVPHIDDGIDPADAVDVLDPPLEAVDWDKVTELQFKFDLVKAIADEAERLLAAKALVEQFKNDG